MCEVGFDGDVCAVWREKAVRARKAHRCDGCAGSIVPGEPYLSHDSLFDGSWSFGRLCWACWLTREQFVDAHPGTLIPNPEGLFDIIEGCVWDDGGESVWTPLLEAMRERKRLAEVHP